MPKLKYKKISKSTTRSQYNFPRMQEFFCFIRGVLSRLNFEENWELEGFGRPLKESFGEEPIFWKEFDMDLEIFDEKLVNFSNKEHSVDIIFFSKEIKVIFNQKRNRQQILADLIEQERKNAKAPPKSKIETNKSIGSYF